MPSIKLSSSICLLGSVALQQQGVSACDPGNADIGAGWQCYTDKKTSHDYYFCKASSTTTWQKADAQKACGSAADASSNQAPATPSSSSSDGSDEVKGLKGPCVPEGKDPTGVEACEGYDYTQEQCGQIGCCQHMDGECWASLDSEGVKCKDYNRKFANTNCKVGADGDVASAPPTVSNKMLGLHLKDACHTDKDYKVWTSSGQANLDHDLSLAGKKCWGTSACVRDEIIRLRGYKKTCATCFGDVSVCTVVHCWMTCISGESAACTECNKVECAPQFIKCSGIPQEQIHASVAIHSRLRRLMEANTSSSTPLMV